MKNNNKTKGETKMEKKMAVIGMILMIAATIGFATLMASCGSKGTVANPPAVVANENANGEVDVYALLKSAAPSDVEIADALITGKAVPKNSALDLAPASDSGSLAPKTVNIPSFKVSLIYMYATSNLTGQPLPPWAKIASGDRGYIMWLFKYFDNTNEPGVKIEGAITFNYVYGGNSFVKADEPWTIAYMAQIAQLTGSVVNTLIDKLTPEARDGFMRGIIVTAIPQSGCPLNKTAKTDAEGNFSLELYVGDTYTLTVGTPGFTAYAKKDIALVAGEVRTIDVDLLPEAQVSSSQAASITGKVLDLDGKGVSGANIVVMDAQGEIVDVVTNLTGISGDYMALILNAPGSYTVLATVGNKTGSWTGTLPGSSNVNIVINDHAPVIDRVVLSNENPSPNSTVTVDVYAHDEDGDMLEYTLSADGSFILNNSPIGTGLSWNTPGPNTTSPYTLTVSVSDGGLTTSTTITVNNPQ
jgi:hypothetical protein